MDFLIFKAPMLMVQASLDGILLGILFALIAYGMALQWGVMNIINIAQGDLVILGGYIAYTIYLWGIHPAWGVIISPIIMFFVGWALYKLVINKVVDRDLFISILATFGIAIVFQQLMNFIFGADVVVAQSEYGTTMLFDNSVTLPNSKIFSAFISVLYAIAIAYKTLIKAENIFEFGRVTELSNNIVVPYSDCATTTSAPKIKFISCWNTIAIPKVANIEINKSRSTTLLITSL